MSADNDLRDALLGLIGKHEGYDSKVVIRKRFGPLADDILDLLKRWDAGSEPK